MKKNELLECRLCYRANFKSLVSHLRTHHIRGAEYLKRFKLPAGSLMTQSLKDSYSVLIKEKFKNDPVFRKVRRRAIKQARPALVAWQSDHPDLIKKHALKASKKGAKARTAYWTPENRQRKSAMQKKVPVSPKRAVELRKYLDRLTLERDRKREMKMALLNHRCQVCSNIIELKKKDSVHKYMKRTYCSNACLRTYQRSTGLNFKQLKERKALDK